MRGGEEEADSHQSAADGNQMAIRWQSGGNQVAIRWQSGGNQAANGHQGAADGEHNDLERA